MYLFLISLLLRYAHGPVPLQSQHYTTSQDIINSVSYIQHEMANYKPNLTQVGSSSSTRSDHSRSTQVSQNPHHKQ